MSEKDEPVVKITTEVVKITKITEVVAGDRPPNLTEKGSRVVTHGNVDRTQPPTLAAEPAAPSPPAQSATGSSGGEKSS